MINIIINIIYTVLLGIFFCHYKSTFIYINEKKYKFQKSKTSFSKKNRWIFEEFVAAPGDRVTDSLVSLLL